MRISRIESQSCTWSVPTVALAGVSAAFCFQRRAVRGVPCTPVVLLLCTGQQPSFPTAHAQAGDLLQGEASICVLSPRHRVRLASWLRAEVPDSIHGSVAGQWLSGPRLRVGPGYILLLLPKPVIWSASNPVSCWVRGVIACKKSNHSKLPFLWVGNTNFVYRHLPVGIS